MTKYFWSILMCTLLLLGFSYAGSGNMQDIQEDNNGLNVWQETEVCHLDSENAGISKFFGDSHSFFEDIDMTAYQTTDGMTTGIFSPKGVNLPKILKFANTAIQVLSLQEIPLSQKGNQDLYAHNCFNNSPCNYYVYTLERILI